MKVFLSWSGDLSRRIATALADWLPPVINAVEPFISLEIDKGAQWAAALSNELQGSRAGIICLTPDNLDSPWLNYEAGALSKSVTADDEAAPARVWTYLFRLRAADVRYPLAQFQHTEATRDDTARLLRGINLAVSRSGERALTEAQLAKAFERWWPVFEEELQSLPQQAEIQLARTPMRPTDEMLAEILELLRSQQGSPDTVSATSELSLSAYVSPSATIYVEGAPQSIIQLRRDLRFLPGVTAAVVGTDPRRHITLSFGMNLRRPVVDESIRSFAQKHNVVVTSIEW